MKNSVHFANTKEETLFIYQIYDNSMFQIARIEPNETIVQNIPVGATFSVKRGKLIHSFLVPIETVMDGIIDRAIFIL